MSKSFATPSTIATRLLCPWDPSGKNTEVGCHFLLQGIFLSQGSNTCLLHQQVDSLPLSHQGSPNPFVKSYIIFKDIYSTFRQKRKKKKKLQILQGGSPAAWHTQVQRKLPLYELWNWLPYLNQSHRKLSKLLKSITLIKAQPSCTERDHIISNHEEPLGPQHSITMKKAEDDIQLYIQSIAHK